MNHPLLEPLSQHLPGLLAHFRNPGVAYRGKPFWSWNGELKADELLRQVHVMHEMGFGGFFMHSRTGLITEYLGDEWFRLINLCADEAEKLGMEAWLYDEDRWPSGTAGGLVTENPEFRAKFISLTPVTAEAFAWDDGIIAAFACSLQELTCTDCARLNSATKPPTGSTVLVFRIEEMARSSFYNGFTYVDTMNRRATDEFLRVTHERYAQRCGDRLGRSIFGVFTDEPHRGPVMSGFGLANENRLRMTPWTPALFDEFRSRFGYDLIDRLPELFLHVDGRIVSPVKLHYMELLMQLYLENYAKPVYDWCDRYEMRLTGHVLHEDSLTAQAAVQGSVMRFYEYMHDPGVDILAESNRCYWVVKQLASVARQLGKKRLLSELYGCTGWQFDFEAHKAVGDWQALFGINVRCHHLSWYTMQGEAKRDFPGSILHQSAWWKEYRYVEDYYARLGLMLSQGEPCCELLVIHPVESLWCQVHAGWAQRLTPQTAEVQALEGQFEELFHWLAGAQIDFDYGDEGLLAPRWAVGRDDAGAAVLTIGEARYRTVLVGGLTTIRASTLRMLQAFADVGGHVVFAGSPPPYVDAVKSSQPDDLAARAEQVSWDQDALVAACRRPLRDQVEIVQRATGRPITDVFCQLRRQDQVYVLAVMNVSREIDYDDVAIRIRRTDHVTELDCRTGMHHGVHVEHRDGTTEIHTSLPPVGEHLYLLSAAPLPGATPRPRMREVAREECGGPFRYALSEPNICVLDVARWRIDDDGGEWQEAAEILRVDRAVRDSLGLPRRAGDMVQPWYRRRSPVSASSAAACDLTLVFTFNVEQIPPGPLFLCMEQPDVFSVSLNDTPIETRAAMSEWIDLAFRRISLDPSLLRMGGNELQLRVHFDEQVDLEAIYLIGSFGVKLDGVRRILTTLPERIAVGTVIEQGLPFYSGAITYELPVDVTGHAAERAWVEIGSFEGACIVVRGAGIVAWPPRELDVTDVITPARTISLELILTRRNTFGPLHQVPVRAHGYGPDSYVAREGFSMPYVLWPNGLRAPPALSWRTERGNELP